MTSVTSRELKMRTGEVLRQVRAGARVVITNRGRPVAILAPVQTPVEDEADGVRSYETAWGEIERTLAKSEPEYPTLDEAMRRSRRRP